VTSAVEARQDGHVLDGLGVMGVAHWQQRIVGSVPVAVGCCATSMVFIGMFDVLQRRFMGYRLVWPWFFEIMNGGR
jgi:hypothetical protein